MPFEYTIDHDRKLVHARAVGKVAEQDVFGYQREVWSRADVAGYNELIDMSGAAKIEQPHTEQMQQLARLSASMDAPQLKSKLAIVAPQLLAFGLGRMYETFREMEELSTKEVRVFHNLDDAWKFLALDEPPHARSQQ
jgi:hypothetical protein